MGKSHFAASLVLLLALTQAAAGQDFNDMRLAAGQAAYADKRYTEAIDEFRVAAFGFLDKPARLSETLARLALAEAGAGRNDLVEDTLNRFLEVERRFAVFPQAQIEPPIRSQFVALLQKRLPPATLSSLPTLSGQPAAASAPVSKAGASAPQSPAARPTATPAPQSSAARPAGPTAVPSPPVPTSAEVLSRSRRLVAEGKAGEAEKLLTAALKADPGNRDLRLSLLEASCLARSYQTTVAQLPMVAPLTDAEGTSLFYVAVALYEVGRKDEAVAYMKRVGGKVSGSLVDEYSRKILGNP